MNLTQTPRQLGYQMPAEWEEHARTIMAWPVVEAAWPGPMEEICTAYAAAVRAITAFEPVMMIVKPKLLAEAQAYCGTNNLEFLEAINDDSWLRDNGPTLIRNNQGELAGVDWLFNAWGEKYPCANDQQIAARVLEHFNIPRFQAPLVMEGGSIHVDGEGTLLTTEACLLNQNRNPHLSRAEIEALVKEYLNVQKIIWLKQGLVGDDTDGHIDNVACFARPGVILLQVSNDPNSPNYQRTREHLEILANTKDAKGRAFEIIKITEPQPVYYEAIPLTLSYLNFYFVNGGIILPTFGGENEGLDQQASKTLARVFPDRKIVPINGLPLARGGGNIHCLTQQIPVSLKGGLQNA